MTPITMMKMLMRIRMIDFLGRTIFSDFEVRYNMILLNKETLS